MSRPAGCAPCTGLRILETVDTLEGATLGRNATRNHTQYPFKFIRMHGVWDFHPCQRPVTEPRMRILGDSLLPRGPVIKHTGPISGPLPLYARVAGTRLHACNQISAKETGRKRSGMPLLRGFQSHTASPVSPHGVVVRWRSSNVVHCLRAIPDNTRNPHMRSTPC